MLRLKGLQLYNWGFAPFQVPLPIGDITLLQGRNGSGKTTYLSALTLLLGANHLPKRQRFERFIYPDAEWAFLRAWPITNQINGKRPFDPVFGSMFEETVTLACVLERKSSWQRTYYIIPGDYVPEPQKRPDKNTNSPKTSIVKCCATSACATPCSTYWKWVCMGCATSPATRAAVLTSSSSW
ncbi:MAG: hypothetical protein IPK53_11420 [bacterium]|nr:hypothetical protein [bacterium]